MPYEVKKVSVVCVIEKDGKYLFLKRSKTGKGDGFLQKTLIWKSISSKFCGTVTLKQSGYNHPMKRAERHK